MAGETRQIQTGCKPRAGRLLCLALRIGEWGYLLSILLLLILSRFLQQVPVWILVPNTFLFYWFLPMLPVAVWGLLRRRLLPHLPALLATLVFLLLFGPQLLPRLATPPDTGITVMSYNIRRGSGGTEPLLGAITPWQPQVIALQEASHPAQDRGDLISQLEDRHGYLCTYRAYYESTRSAGIGVCVQPPIVLHNVQRRTYHDRGRWSYLFAEMIAGQGNTNLNLIVPHLVAFRISGSDPVSDPRYTLRRLRWATHWHHRETAELLRLIEGFRDPTIMAGDFNSTPNQGFHVRIRKTLRDAFREAGCGLGATYRFFLPIRIDYIYVSHEIEVLAAATGMAGPSDHRPVIARVRP